MSGTQQSEHSGLRDRAVQCPFGPWMAVGNRSTLRLSDWFCIKGRAETHQNLFVGAGLPPTVLASDSRPATAMSPATDQHGG